MSRLFQAIAMILALALPAGAAQPCAGDREAIKAANGTHAIATSVASESDAFIPKTAGGRPAAPREGAKALSSLDAPRRAASGEGRGQAEDFIKELNPFLSPDARQEKKRNTPSPEKTAAPKRRTQEGTPPPQTPEPDAEALLIPVKPEPDQTPLPLREQPSPTPGPTVSPTETPPYLADVIETLEDVLQPERIEEDERRERVGFAVGTTGGIAEASVVVTQEGIIEQCGIKDETQTKEMETGYELACSFVTGRSVEEIANLSKKAFMSRINAYSQEAGRKLSSGGNDADAALTAFLAIKDAITQR